MTKERKRCKRRSSLAFYRYPRTHLEICWVTDVAFYCTRTFGPVVTVEGTEPPSYENHRGGVLEEVRLQTLRMLVKARSRHPFHYFPVVSLPVIPWQ